MNVIDWNSVSLGISREDLIRLLGPPDDMEYVAKNDRPPSIYKYGDIEFHFSRRADSVLWLIYTEDADGTPHTLKIDQTLQRH
jgi:hypothetical protein